jgi:hypothetical protein
VPERPGARADPTRSDRTSQLPPPPIAPTIDDAHILQYRRLDGALPQTTTIKLFSSCDKLEARPARQPKGI